MSLGAIYGIFAVVTATVLAAEDGDISVFMSVFIGFALIAGFCVGMAIFMGTMTVKGIRSVAMYKHSDILLLRNLVAARLLEMPSMVKSGKKLSAHRIDLECFRLIRASDKSAIRMELAKRNALAPRASLPSIQLSFDPVGK
jgi:hypothetical protein